MDAVGGLPSAARGVRRRRLARLRCEALAATAEADELEAWMLTGLVEDPGPNRPQPVESGGVRFEGGDGNELAEADRDFSGWVFVDGVCFPQPFRSAWRAG